MGRCDTFRRRLFLGAALLIGVSGHPARAAEPGEAMEAEGQGLDEILVTARRQAESLIDVPVAVTALGSEDIARYAATDLTKIAQLAPQVMVAAGYSGAGASFVIRGIGSSAADAGIEQAVSINVDGVQLSRGRIATASMFDIQQVEILKGPQALFYGKNSPAGVISIKSAGPTDTFGGYLTAGYEFVADQAFVEGAISGPISDTLKARLAFRGSTMKGWVNNVAKPSANVLFPSLPYPGRHAARMPGQEEVAARLTTVWTPSDGFEMTLKLLGGYNHSNEFGGVYQSFCAPGVASTTSGVADVQDDCTYDDTVAYGAPPAVWVQNWPAAKEKPYSEQKYFLGTLGAEYRINDHLTLNSTTGLAHINTKGFGNSGASAISNIFNSNPEKSTNVTQELRLNSDYEAPVNFMFGLFYEHSSRVSSGHTRINNFGTPDPVTGKWFSYSRTAEVKGETLSAFAQLRWDVLENLEVAGGVRYTRETRDLNLRHDYLDSRLDLKRPTDFRTPGVPIIAHRKESNWSPEATITWNPLPNTTLYAAYKTGYKAGGFTNPGRLQNSYDQSNVGFDEETVEGGEIGFKARLFGGRGRIETAIYSYTFSDLQLSTFDGATISYQVRNAAKARTRGFEVSGELRATDELTLRGALAYNQARFLSFPNAQCYSRQATIGTGCVLIPGQTTLSQNLSGRPLTRAPDWSANIGATYDMPITDKLAIGLTGDASYRSEYHTVDSLDPFAIQPGFWLFNASVVLRDVKDTWQLSLIGRNHGNKYFRQISSERAGGAAGNYISPTQRAREFMVQMKYNF